MLLREPLGTVVRWCTRAIGAASARFGCPRGGRPRGAAESDGQARLLRSPRPLSRDADEAAIRKAYRKLAFDNHPDRNPNDAQAEQRFKEVTEAYEVLRDSEQRARYDRFGHAATGGGGAAPDFSGFDLADALRAFMRDFGGDAGGFEDLFNASTGRQGPQRGDDLQLRLKLSLEEIATGVEKRIRVKHDRACQTCKGRGGTGGTTCTQCAGRGQVRRVQQSFFGQFVNVSVCPRCHGEGRTFKEPCKTCRGEGRTSETETIAVRIPPGVANGNFIPVRGMGDAGPRGGPAGDLIVLIEEKPHPLFRREGDDLHADAPVSFPTLALGGKIEVPTLDGNANLDISSGTPSGRVLPGQRKGLPGLRGGKGDLMVRLTVFVPTRVSGGEKKLLEELGRSDGLKPPRPGKSTDDRVKDAFA
jgi:molecular chaperone DnaJ